MKVHFTSQKKIHFMGIGGSGMSAAASLAHEMGYIVDGCDINVDTPYIDKLKGKISISEGHSSDHLKDKDLLVVTPAVYFDKPSPDEFLKAKNKMTWQEFVGKYLQRDKEVICVAGTHGKSTTTAMLANVFGDASALIGAKLRQTGTNYRFSNGSKFIIEADEFYDSFLHYDPDAIILNNIEFDHPDFFKNKEQMLDSYFKFVNSLKGRSVLVYNKDSKEVVKLMKRLVGKKINFVSYSIKDQSADFYGSIKQKTSQHTKFDVVSSNNNLHEEITLHLVGDYNVSNALGVIALSSVYSIEPQRIKKVLNNFYGIGRRMELVGEKDGVKIYDDYAHHPTAIKETLKGLRQKYPSNKIIAVIEPHSYSRTKSLLSKYKNVFINADEVIIAPIFKARDTEDFGVNEESIAKASNHKNIKTIGSFDEIAKYFSKKDNRRDVVIVMGAGKSHELARKLLA